MELFYCYWGGTYRTENAASVIACYLVTRETCTQNCPIATAVSAGFWAYMPHYRALLSDSSGNCFSILALHADCMCNPGVQYQFTGAFHRAVFWARWMQSHTLLYSLVSILILSSHIRLCLQMLFLLEVFVSKLRYSMFIFSPILVASPCISFSVTWWPW